jgi:hypothetical protein
VDVAAAVRGEAHREHLVVLGLGRDQLGQDRAEARMALALKDVEGEGHVPRRQLRAVVEARFRPEEEAVGQLVLRHPHRPRHESVERVRLVAGAGHQGIEGAGHPRGSVALQDVDVQGVEGVEVLVTHRLLDLEGERASLGRVRTDVW